MVPAATRVAALVNPANAVATETTLRDVEQAAGAMGLPTGHFLTIFATSALRFSIRRPELKVLHIELPMASVPSGIVTLKHRMLSPVAQLFVDGARKVAKQLAKRK